MMSEDNNNTGNASNTDSSEKPQEEKNAEELTEEQKKEEEEVKKELKGLFGGSSKFFSKLLDIRKDTDQEEAKKDIVEAIPFKGHTAWILVCSIFVCSVGLNANSTAVVIGAMLIAPLMGPILGVGLSIATNDLDTLRRSLFHFGVMIFLSVLTAFLFFILFPLREESSELLARTGPDIRDVVIAFFGGLALIVARAKRGTMASVIYGVAIGTALMPPLCTVGFGLAIGNLSYAAGAFYLFLINTIYIALATVIVLKYLRFPMVKYVNSRKRRIISRIATVVAILVMVPAGITFYNTLQESRFKTQASQFVNQTIGAHDFDGEGRYIDNLTEITYTEDGNSSIQVVAMGEGRISDEIIQSWKEQLNDFGRLSNTELIVIQGADNNLNEQNYLSELYETNKAQLQNKDAQIDLLEKEVGKLKNTGFGIPFDVLSKEARTIYADLEEMGFSWRISTDFDKQDTIPVFQLKWRNTVSEDNRQILEDQFVKWIQVRLGREDIKVEKFQD